MYTAIHTWYKALLCILSFQLQNCINISNDEEIQLHMYIEAGHTT